MNNQVLNKHCLKLQNKISDSEKLSDMFSVYSNTLEISDDISSELRLVIEETFINIASYAYKSNKPEPVTIEFCHTHRNISITFTDNGFAFNPLTDAKTCEKNDDHCEGGMGIRLIISLTDEQEYQRVGQSNVFTVTKHYT